MSLKQFKPNKRYRRDNVSDYVLILKVLHRYADMSKIDTKLLEKTALQFVSDQRATRVGLWPIELLEYRVQIGYETTRKTLAMDVCHEVAHILLGHVGNHHLSSERAAWKLAEEICIPTLWTEGAIYRIEHL